MSTSEPPVIECLPPFNTAEYFADPYPTFAAIREVAPMVRVELPPHWFVTGHAEGNSVLRHAGAKAEGFARRQRAIRSRYGDDFDPLIELVRLQMVLMNAPDHPRVRRALQAVFTPRAIEDMRPLVQRVVRERLAAVDAADGFDLIRDLASPLPAIVVATLLGVPEQDTPRFVRWSSELVEFVGTTRSDLAHLGRVQADMIEWSEFFKELANHERGGETILARLVGLTETDQLSWTELVSNAIFLMAAGHETTTSLIGNGTLALSRAPSQWARLRDDRRLVRHAVEELLRYDAPVQFAWRVVSEPMTIGGVELPIGDMVNVGVGAANRDPLVFAQPDRLDIDRRPDEHLAFAQGAHYCLGAALARMEGQEAFIGLLDAFPTLAVDGIDVPRFRRNPTFRGLESLRLSRTC